MIAGALLMLITAGGASADDTHYRGVPIGAHSIALGGAFTGVADDASAAYFNPGGLGLSQTLGITGGLTINAWERFELDEAFNRPEGLEDATAKRARTVPIFIGAAVKFGPKDSVDEKRHTLAVSVLEPIFSRGSVFLRTESDPLQLSDSYQFGGADRATWYGVSFASRLDVKQAVGASLYLSDRRLSHDETGLALSGGMPIEESNVFIGTSSAANTQSLGFKAYHFVLRFGWLRRFTPELQLGLMLQPPGIPLRQTVKVVSQGFVNDNRDPNLPSTTEAFFLDEKLDANLPIPAEIEAGLEYWPADTVMLSFDGSFHAPVPSKNRIQGVSTSLPIGGLFFDLDTGRRAIGNVAVAGDFYVSKRIVIETGFFTDLSSAKAVPEDPDRYYNPQINRFAGTLSMRLDVTGVAFSVGSTVLFGRGDATGVVVDASNLQASYVRTDARSRIVYLHITGATRVAEDIADRTARGLKARRAAKQGNAEDSE